MSAGVFCCRQACSRSAEACRHMAGSSSLQAGSWCRGSMCHSCQSWLGGKSSTAWCRSAGNKQNNVDTCQQQWQHAFAVAASGTWLKHQKKSNNPQAICLTEIDMHSRCLCDVQYSVQRIIGTADSRDGAQTAQHHPDLCSNTGMAAGELPVTKLPKLTKR